MANTNEELFERTPIPQAVTKMMVPVILGSLVMVIYNLADTFFVGMLNDEIQSAAVSLAAPAMLAFNAVNNLFGTGTSSMMSRALGTKDFKAVRESASFGFYGSIFFSLLLSIGCFLFLEPLMILLGAQPATMQATREYMMWAVVLGAVPSILNSVLGYIVRAEGAALQGTLGAMSGCVLNIILDPFFIMPWGLGMGSAGAGCATFISNCVACGYFFVYLIVNRSKTNIRLHPKHFKLSKKIMLGICGVGIPASIQNLLNVTGMTVMNNFVKSYGAAAVAAVGIAQKIYMVPMQIALGGTQGIMPLVSYSYSARKSDRFKDCILFVAKIMVPAIALVALLGWVFAHPLIQLFIDNAEVVAYGVLFLRGFAAGLPFMLLDFLAVGVFQSVGMGGKSLVFALLRKIVLEIPAIVILNMLFHESGITYAGCVAEMVLAVVGVIILRKIIVDMGRQTAALEDIHEL
ncbi:MAG: MATE family efflux transporter [Muribaculum sp.]|nr:MATE family efflux transporter [Muribaculum sp.]